MTADEVTLLPSSLRHGQGHGRSQEARSERKIGHEQMTIPVQIDISDMRVIPPKGSQLRLIVVLYSGEFGWQRVDW